MRSHALFVVTAVAAVGVLTGGQKLSYAENPNNYNCDDTVVEYVNPIDQMKTREIKSSYVYYNTPQEHLPVKYSMKYGPVRRYYSPAKKESRFYQVFQSAGERTFDQSVKGTSGLGQSKTPAIQIYVV